ncbi:VOC family protein [Chelatococcus sambhunathii]|uniref:VOC family protein n=1 Tax=Chelatococcus sambhunathii TaxID=363953 RepID=A0ABU1DCU8_9HYPH|nr:VOC family protein [Chelatococcus sambhunathii]MDR4305939.1 VOC family protein [Chelatococcus sambhunathii]
MTSPVIRGVNHIGITVPDIEAAKVFLMEAFGGQLIYQSFGPLDPPRQGPEFERAVGASPGTVVRAQAMVKIGTGADIELFEMHGPEQTQPVRASDFGITHFALYTDDIEASVARFEKAGGTPFTAPRAIPYATERGAGNRVCYGRTPWGTTMEFITTPDRMAYHDQTDLRRWQDED